MLVYRMPPLSQLAYIIPKRIASTTVPLLRTGSAGAANWEIRQDFEARQNSKFPVAEGLGETFA
jgi:hypothetical protein